MKKILIIEDDPLIARVYGTKYASAGFETSIATDGEAGLALLESFKPDLVHLDLLVPKVNGVEIVRHIRSRPDMQSLPIIVLSNTYQNHLTKAVMAAGATEMVSKSTCTPKMMVDIVQKYRSRMREAVVPPSVLASAPVPASSPSEASPAPQAEPVEVAPSPTASLATEGAEALALRETDRQAAFQSEIRQGFTSRAPGLLQTLRERVEPLLRAENEATQVPELSEISRITHSFASHAAIAGFEELSQMASALVALLNEVLEAHEKLTDSCLRTIVDACDFLPDLLERSAEGRPDTAAPMVLIVDDDPISRRAVRLAIARLRVATLCVEDPGTALRLLQENRFDLTLLDVDMPGLDGFGVCLELRALPMNAATPVVFVTTFASPENRERAAACGGNDLIAKPFLPMELAVKALSLLRRRPL